MAEPVEVAIEMALLDRATVWAAAQSPVITISEPNIVFTPPSPDKTAKWLRCSFLPADTVALGVGYSSTNQHYGILQIDAMYGFGGGEPAIARLAAQVIALFDRGTEVTKDGFKARVWKKPFRGPLLKDDVWMMIPVSIPYIAFAPNPA